MIKTIDRLAEIRLKQAELRRESAALRQHILSGKVDLDGVDHTATITRVIQLRRKPPVN